MTHNVNFYDASLRTRREWLTAGTTVSAVAACALAVTLVAAWARHDLAQLHGPALDTGNKLQAAQAELAEMTRQVTNYKPNERMQAELRLAQTSLGQRQAALDMLRNGGLGVETGHAAALSAFARQSISGLWLTGLVLDNQQVALRGRSLTPDLIPTYVNRLNKEDALKGRAFRALDIARPAAAASAASGARQGAGFVEFSLVSAQGNEAPAKPAAKEGSP